METEFKCSEKRFLKLILGILRNSVGTELRLQDIEVKFGRRYVDSLVTKTQALQTLLQIGIAPQVAIPTVGIWNDPTDVFLQSKQYLSQWEVNDDEDVRADGHVHEETAGDDPQGVREEPSDDGDGRT